MLLIHGGFVVVVNIPKAARVSHRTYPDCNESGWLLGQTTRGERDSDWGKSWAVAGWAGMLLWWCWWWIQKRNWLRVPHTTGWLLAGFELENQSSFRRYCLMVCECEAFVTKWFFSFGQHRYGDKLSATSGEIRGKRRGVELFWNLYYGLVYGLLCREREEKKFKRRVRLININFSLYFDTKLVF